MENIEILNMTLNDYEEIKDILTEEFDNFWTPEILKTEILGENKKYIVAKKDNEIVGFTGILINTPECELMNIVIKKSERRNGIGTLLLEKIIEIVKDNKIEEIFLEVNENNNEAINLYKKLGFKNIGLRKKYYNSTENAILMSKKVNIL